MAVPGSASLEPRFRIQKSHWEHFKNYVNETYPRDSFTHEQKEFVKKYLKQDDDKCSDINCLWINHFADQLIEFADNWPQSHEAISDQLERLQAITGKAILGLFNCQHALRQLVHSSQRSLDQQRMLEVHPNIINFPLELTIDIGRILYLKKGATGEHIPGGADTKTENQQLFHQLHNHIIQISKHGQNVSSSQGPSDTQSVRSETGTEPPSGEWESHSSEDTYMRLCTYKVWCDKYEQEHEWSPAKMLGPWLRESIQLYNNVSYHWPQCKIKRFDDSQFTRIRQTAHGWVHNVPQKAPVTSKTQKPASNWITDWCTYPVTEKRHEWESYFCNIMLHAKNLARLLNRHERVTEESEATESTEEHAPKRQRTEEEESHPEEHTPEFKMIRHVNHEFRQLRKLIVQLDRNSNIRHQETLREMLGHFNPLRNQILHLNSGQNHLSHMIDRLAHK